MCVQAMSASRLRSTCQELPQAAFQRATRDEDTVITAQASDPNICSQAKHLPIIAPAGMWFPESKDVVDTEGERLARIISGGGLRVGPDR